MLYAIISEDIADSLALRMANRPAHVQRLEALKEEGRLLVAGPHPSIDSLEPGESGFSGSLIIAEFESLIDAKNWAEQDPYVLNGVHSSVQVKPFKKVLP